MSETKPNPIIDALDDADGASDQPKRDECPVEILGCCEGVYYFLSKLGEKREMTPRDFSTTGITSLLDGNTWWLYKHFSREDKEGNVIGFKNGAVAAFLMRECSQKGLFNPLTPIRDIGVWRGAQAQDGRQSIIVHAGARVWHKGQWTAAGIKLGSDIFPSRPAASEFDTQQEASAEEGKLLYRIISKWNWQRGELDAGFATGFIGAGMYGAAPDWRAHLLVHGERGTGKSTLMELIYAVLGDGGAHEPTSNYTEAGLRQRYSGSARVMILDEAEPSESGHGMQSVIRMLRGMSDKRGAQPLRGSSGGSHKSFDLNGSAFLGAILPVPMTPQDRSRITQIGLNKIDTSDPASGDKLTTAVQEIAALSPKFRARMINRWPQFLDTVEFYRHALIRNELDPRAAVQIGTLLAGRDVLTSDYLPTTDVFNDQLEGLKGLIDDEKDRVETGNEGIECLNYLYTSLADSHVGGHRQIIGQLVFEAMNGPESPQTHNKILATYGIRVHYIAGTSAKKNMASQLLIAKQHTGLARVFAGTRWRDGGWVGALEYLRGGKPAVDTARFGGAPTRLIVVPPDHWPNLEGDD